MTPKLSTTLTESRKQVARGEIATVALRLFLDQGYGATSVEEIATAAGCSASTFYRYFGTKEAVLFHDLEVQKERLEEILDHNLDAGLGLWDAVTETMVAVASRFGPEDEDVASTRMGIWLNEPAARGRFVSYMIEAEEIIADRLRRHRGSDETDDLPRLIAGTAATVYRIVVLTHHSNGGATSITDHLRAALTAVGDGSLGRVGS